MNFIPYYTLNTSHSEALSDLYFSYPSSTLSSKQLLATSSNDKYISIYSLSNTNEPVPSVNMEWKYKYHLYGINKLIFNKDNTLLASGSNDLSVNVVDVNKQCLLRNFRHESIVTCLDFNSTSNLLIVGTYDYSIFLYDMRSRNLVIKIISDSEPITSVTFSDDCSVIYSTSYDSFCRIWDCFKFNCLKTIALENSPSINSCTVLPNERYVMLNAFNSQIEIIDIVTEEEIKKFKGHKHSNYLVDCDYYKGKNGKYYVVSGDEEGKMWNWEVKGEGKKYVKVGDGNMVVNAVDTCEGLVAVSGVNDVNNAVYLFKEEEEDYSKE